MSSPPTVNRSPALILSTLDFWSSLSHEVRRFTYETVSDMMRLGVPGEQYDSFLAWIADGGYEEE